jgi:hypothetical protein
MAGVMTERRPFALPESLPDVGRTGLGERVAAWSDRWL